MKSHMAGTLQFHLISSFLAASTQMSVIHNHFHRTALSGCIEQTCSCVKTHRLSRVVHRALYSRVPAAGRQWRSTVRGRDGAVHWPPDSSVYLERDPEHLEKPVGCFLSQCPWEGHSQSLSQYWEARMGWEKWKLKFFLV